jgi:hypothetical protein
VLAPLAPTAAWAVGEYTPPIDGSRIETPKTVGDTNLAR